MAELVKRAVKKSGKVISLERVSDIYNRHTNNIWDKIKDEIDKIPLEKFENFHKVIFKALCKEFKNTGLVLLALELNQPAIENMIAEIFIKEAAKLSKKPSCIHRFFSSIGRLFCFTRKQNKADVM
ncbi:unnamed protein product [Oreochromis niloticus]|nr:unnamed protein product [Mustela putorius furo]